MPRTVGIGLDDFSEIIQNNCFYIDKTLFIKEWWESFDKVTLITRPRRFGKTLAVSMVEQFFSVKYAGRGNLFESLAIWQEKAYRDLQGTYPVISLSFASVKERNYKDVREKICQLIAQQYNSYFFLLESDSLTQPEKEAFLKIAGNDMDDVTAAMALQQLSKYLYEFYGKKVILLLDEYDTPMQEAYVNGYWDELAYFTRSMFNSAFKSNPWLGRAVMTGITRVSRESVFSDLNNLTVVTTTSTKYETAFGFTEEEVFAGLEEFGLQDRESEVKEWYDGFRFGGCDNIYNPWSVVNFFSRQQLHAYWANTSENLLVNNLIRKGGTGMKLIMEDLLNGSSFRTVIDEEVIYSQLDVSVNAVWSLLLASGYLKAKGVQLNRRGKMEYILAITNKEVHFMFDQMFAGWFSSKNLNYSEFSDALLSGNKEAMNAYINQIAQITFSSFDSGMKPSEFKQPENFYHGFVLGLIADLRNIYHITSNRESGFGRYDVMLEPLDPQAEDGIILEFKIQDAESEKSLQDTVDAALQQIIDKKYAAALAAKGIPAKKIRAYGFAFKGKEILIGGGLVQSLDV